MPVLEVEAPIACESSDPLSSFSCVCGVVDCRFFNLTKFIESSVASPRTLGMSTETTPQGALMTLPPRSGLSAKLSFTERSK